MSRCKHGFLLGVVACPLGCGGTPVDPEAMSELAPVQRERRVATRAISNAKVAKAIAAAGSLEGAARELGCTPETIYYRSRKSPEIRAALAARRPGLVRQPRGSRHPGWVDMRGWQGGGWEVLREVEDSLGVACWETRHSCGRVQVFPGIRLRRAAPRCRTCEANAKGAA